MLYYDVADHLPLSFSDTLNYLQSLLSNNVPVSNACPSYGQHSHTEMKWNKVPSNHIAAYGDCHQIIKLISIEYVVMQSHVFIWLWSWGLLLSGEDRPTFISNSWTVVSEVPGLQRQGHHLAYQCHSVISLLH